MKIYTVFDDQFLTMAKSFFNSAKYYSDMGICAHLSPNASRSIEFCKSNQIEYYANKTLGKNPKQISRLLKMSCSKLHKEEEPIAYLDIDIVFQNNVRQLEDLNPNYLWVLSRREGHQTTLRTWKRHYFTKSTVEFVRKVLPSLTDLPVEELLISPVRNCGVIYGNRSVVHELLTKAKEYYLKMLEINKKSKHFSDSDQLCFVLAFFHLKDKIKELPLKFNRMPYHQSYDFKDRSCFFIPDNVILHLNRCKSLGKEIVDSWSINKKPNIQVEPNTRSGIVIPIQTSNIAERALTKNFYSLAVSNRANVYQDEYVGFPIEKRRNVLDEIRNNMKGERPAYDKGLFFLVNDFMFMIDHGEHVGNRAAWIIGKYVNPHQLAGIFIEQMAENLDVTKSKIPIIPLTYGTKQPNLWLNQGLYHDLGLNCSKKYSVHFIGNFGTNKRRQKQADIISQIPNSKIENKSGKKRLSFAEYMKDLASARIVWNPPGGRPKTHREIEAMCCEVAVMMPKQRINEPEKLKPDIDYICIRDDHSDAVEKANHYLNHPDELSIIAHNGRMWYERNASDYARAKFIHEKALEIIGDIK